MLASDCYLLLGGLLVWLLRAIVRHVSIFSIMETLVGDVRSIGLHRGGIGVPLTWCLLITLLLVLLALLKLVALRVRTMIPLIR